MAIMVVVDDVLVLAACWDASGEAVASNAGYQRPRKSTPTRLRDAASWVRGVHDDVLSWVRVCVRVCGGHLVGTQDSSPSRKNQK